MSETATSPGEQKAKDLILLEGLGFSPSLSLQGLDNGDGTVTGAIEWILQEGASRDRDTSTIHDSTAVGGDLLPSQDQEEVALERKEGGITHHARDEKKQAGSSLGAIDYETPMADAPTLPHHIGELKNGAVSTEGSGSKITSAKRYSASTFSSMHNNSSDGCTDEISAPEVAGELNVVQKRFSDGWQGGRGGIRGSGMKKDPQKAARLRPATKPGALAAKEPTTSDDGMKDKKRSARVEVADESVPSSGLPPLGIGIVEWVGETDRIKEPTTSTKVRATSLMGGREHGKFSPVASGTVTANAQGASWVIRKGNPGAGMNMRPFSVQTQEEGEMKSDSGGKPVKRVEAGAAPVFEDPDSIGPGSNDRTQAPSFRSISSGPPDWEGFDDEIPGFRGVDETQVSPELLNETTSAFPDTGETREHPDIQSRQQGRNEQMVHVPEAYTVNDIVEMELVDAEPIDQKRRSSRLRALMLVLLLAILCAASVLIALGATGNLGASSSATGHGSPTPPPSVYQACDYDGSTDNVRAGCWIQIAEDVEGTAPESLGAGASRGPNFGSSVSLSEVVKVVEHGVEGKRTTAIARVAVSAPDEVSSETQIGVVRVYDLDLLASRDIGDNTLPQLTQVGQNIVGFTDGNRAQRAVLSGDGQRLAVGGIRQGVPSSDDGESLSLAGWVQMYDLIEEDSSDKVQRQTWEPIGSAIFGKKVSEEFGKKIALSYDGSVLVVGATGFGLVRVYRLLKKSGTDRDFSWVQMGADIKGPTGGDDGFGQAVGVTDDGIKMVVGAPKETSPNGLFRAGCVRVYHYVGDGANNDVVVDKSNNGGSWLKLGRDLCGNSSDGRFGTSVSVSSNGKMLAVSAPNHDRIVPEPRGGIINGTDGGNGIAENVGCVRVFSFAEDSSTNASMIDWMQVGNDVIGDEAGDKLSVVSLSADGASFATGSASGGIDGTGYVRVYGLAGNISSGEWWRMGGTLAGQESGQRFGSHLSLSRDARFIAVGSPFANSRGGAVRLFELGWIQVGGDLSRGSRLGEEFGYDISIANSGDNRTVPRTRIAISAPKAGEEKTGAVFVYDVGQDHSFVKVGQTLYGAPGDKVRGYLSKDARRLAVGERYNDGSNSTQKDIGLVRVFELSTNSSSEQNWTSVGQLLYGDESNEQSGKAVRLNYDGSILAIGARWAKGDRGRVRVYELQEGGDRLEQKWIPRGQDIIGENPGEGLGWNIDISDDGTVVVASGSTTDEAGFMRVYQYRLATSMWDLVGNITGEAAGDKFGGYTAISGDGLTVAGGSKEGFPDERGYIRVFKFDQDANEWEKIGGNIDGEEADANLRVVSLSEDGRRVGTSSGETQNHTGFVAVYDLVNGRWNRVGGKIFGQKPKTNFGHIHAMSRDGSRLVATAPAHGQKSLGLEATMSGLVRLYDLPPPFGS